MASREHERLSRRDLLLRGSAAVGALAAADLLAACGGGDDEAAPSAATTQTAAATETTAITERFPEFNVGSVAPFFSLDPTGSGSGEGYFAHTFEPLIHRKNDRSLIPALAAEPLERLDDTTWRATLREGRTFTDGAPITAEDVKFTFDRIADPEYASPFHDYLAFIDGVEIVDPMTVELKMKVPTDLVPDRVALARIVPKHVVTAKGNKEFARNPEVGSGAMIHTSRFDTNRVVIERYEDYNGVLPVGVDRATYLYVPEAQTRIAQAESGQLHLIDGLPPSLYDAVRNSAGLELGLTPVEQSSFVEVVMFHCGKKPFADKRVRQAFMYGIDRDQLIEIGMLGNGAIAHSPLPDSHPLYTEPSIVYEYDPERAKSLLNDAGYPDGISFELLVASWDYVKPQAPLFEQQLKPAGFNAKLKVVPIDTYFSEIFAGRYESFVFTIGFELFSYDVDMLLRGWWNNFYGEKAMFWTTPEAGRLQEVLDQALGEQDDGTKKGLYAEAQQIIVEEAATCPILFQPVAHAWRKEVAGYEMPFTIGTHLFTVRPA